MYVRQHPGTVIRELWMDGDSDLGAAARRIGVPPEEWMLFLDGHAPLTPRLAAKLETAGWSTAGWSTAAFWMRLQGSYDLARERAA